MSNYREQYRGMPTREFLSQFVSKNSKKLNYMIYEMETGKIFMFTYDYVILAKGKDANVYSTMFRGYNEDGLIELPHSLLILV